MATIKIIQRPKPLSNGLYPIFLRITKNRKTKFISLNLSCEKAQWNENKSEFRRNYANYKQFNTVLTDIKSRAQKIVSDYTASEQDITLEQFTLIFKKSNQNANIINYFNEMVNAMIAEGRTGNANVYYDTKNSIIKFSNDRLQFSDITPKFLSDYESYLRRNGGSDSGISVKMRTIRAVFNDAIRKEVVKQNLYPFKVYKISKFKKTNTKRALSVNDIQKIVNLDTNENSHLIDTKNYFLFSYYTRGMNFYDMMMLKWKDIKSDKIFYVRRKTKKAFAIQILEPVRIILEYYRKQKRPTQYVFPILLKDKLTPMQIEHRKFKILKHYNKQLKEVAKVCEIEENITSYVARHSFATHLKQKGVSTDIISEAMGHQNLNITQAYLKDLENIVVDDAMKKLL
jgi:site-specific recombinase XerD